MCNQTSVKHLGVDSKINNCKIDEVTRVLTRPRSQSSSAISDATSNKKKGSEIGWDSLINFCHQIHRVVGEVSFEESFRVYTC